MNLLSGFYFVCGIVFALAGNKTRYAPTWESLHKRPLPQWYDNAKFGIFLHWGVYSVPSFAGAWFWMDWRKGRKATVRFMERNYHPNFTYQEFASQFRAEFFDPKEWADLFKQAGAQYVTLTSKHHDGYCLWPSPHSYSWNSMDVGPKRDLIGDLATAVRSRGLRFGLYHSLYEWFNPIYNSDRNSHFKKNRFVNHKMYPEMVDLVKKYKPEVWWSDGDREATDTYFKSREFLAWLYNDSPVKDTIVVNDRWGKDIPCKHGDFYTCIDNYDPGKLIKHKWESASRIDKKSWGYRRHTNLQDYRTTEEIISLLVRTVSCGGNLALNLGPTSDGRIDMIFQERLLEVGQWLSINGEAIYKSKYWVHQNDSIAGTTWYTSQSDALYAITTKWPVKNKIELGSVFKWFKNGSIDTITLLGSSNKLKFALSSNSVIIQFPDKATIESKWAWTLKFKKDDSDHTD